MNAKELYARFSSLTDVEVFQHRVVIARALSLLASVEDGEGIVRELEECERIVGNLCADGRCPKMSIPVRDDDEDMRLTRTMKQAAARITLDAQEKAALKGQADVLDALNTSQAHEISLLKAELASVKAERDESVKRAFQLGQTYWQQADSQYESQNRKSDETMARYKQLLIGSAAHPKEGA